MKRTERTVNVKAWGCLGAKRVVLYEDRDELRFTDGFHDMRMTQARMEAFVPGGDAVLADVYRRVRGTRSWHPVVKELKKMGVEKAPEQYSQQMYNGKWKTVIEFNLADDVPDEINLPEQKGQMYWYEMWRDLRIVTKAPKEKRSRQKKNWRRKSRKESRRK